MKKHQTIKTPPWALVFQGNSQNLGFALCGSVGSLGLLGPASLTAITLKNGYLQKLAFIWVNFCSFKPEFVVFPFLQPGRGKVCGTSGSFTGWRPLSIGLLFLLNNILLYRRTTVVLWWLPGNIDSCGVPIDHFRLFRCIGFI